MTKIETFEDLFLLELKDLYSAETQIIDALPKMAEAASSRELKTAFKEHLEETREQKRRLEEIFEFLERKPGGETCQAAKGLIKESDELISNVAEGPVRDAALIGAGQRVEHYEIAGYGTAKNFAAILGYNRCENLLDRTLQEEAQTDKKLNMLAKRINSEAVSV